MHLLLILSTDPSIHNGMTCMTLASYICHMCMPDRSSFPNVIAYGYLMAMARVSFVSILALHFPSSGSHTFSVLPDSVAVRNTLLSVTMSQIGDLSWYVLCVRMGLISFFLLSMVDSVSVLSAPQVSIVFPTAFIFHNHKA